MNRGLKMLFALGLAGSAAGYGVFAREATANVKAMMEKELGAGSAVQGIVLPFPGGVVVLGADMSPAAVPGMGKQNVSASIMILSDLDEATGRIGVFRARDLMVATGTTTITADKALLRGADSNLLGSLYAGGRVQPALPFAEADVSGTRVADRGDVVTVSRIEAKLEEGGRIDRLALADLLATGIDGSRASLARMELAGLDWRFLPMLDDPFAVGQPPKAALESFLLEGGEAVSGKGDRLTVARLEAKQEEKSGVMEFSAWMGGFLLKPFVPEGEGAVAISGLPEEGVGADMKLKVSYDSARRRLALSPLEVDFAAGGKLEMECALENVPDPRTGRVDATAASAISLGTLDIRFSDAGMVKSAIEKRAARQGVTPAEQAGKLAWDWRLAAERNGFRGRRVEKALAQIEAFLANPHKITLAMKPGRPLSLAGVAMAAAIQPALLSGIVESSGLDVVAETP